MRRAHENYSAFRKSSIYHERENFLLSTGKISGKWISPISFQMRTTPKSLSMRFISPEVLCSLKKKNSIHIYRNAENEENNIIYILCYFLHFLRFYIYV